MNIIDKVGAPRAVAFVTAKLHGYDTSQLDWFKILPLQNWPMYRGRCTYPKRIRKRSRSFVHGYRIRCSVHYSSARYPFAERVEIGTVVISPRRWEYVKEAVEYADKDELAVFLAGHEAFHWLRHSRQVPGRNTQCQANALGLTWLKEFRASPAEKEIHMTTKIERILTVLKLFGWDRLKVGIALLDYEERHGAKAVDDIIRFVDDARKRRESEGWIAAQVGHDLNHRCDECFSPRTMQ